MHIDRNGQTAVRERPNGRNGSAKLPYGIGQNAVPFLRLGFRSLFASRALDFLSQSFLDQYLFFQSLLDKSFIYERLFRSRFSRYRFSRYRKNRRG